MRVPTGEWRLTLPIAHVLLAALVAAATTTEIRVVDGSGNAVSQARATAGGAVFTADARGRIFVTANGSTSLVEAPGCSAKTVELSAPRVSVSLSCRLPVIGSVRVATGSLQALHQLPVPASVLDREQIATNPATTADGLLRVMPGVDRNRSNSLFTNYGQVRVSFTGAGTDRGLVLVDGVPAQDGFGGQINWALYPTLDLTRAELLRGAGSALYGPGAVGGVLALQSVAPPGQYAPYPQGQLVMQGGTHAFSQLYAGVATSLSPKLSMSVSSQTQRLQYDALAPGYQAPSDTESQAQASMASLRLRYAASDSAIFEYGYRGAWDYQQEGRRNYDFWRRMAQNSLAFDSPTPQANLSVIEYVRNAFVTNRADQFPADPGALRYTQYVPTNESGTLAQWTVDGGPSSFSVRADERFINGVSDQYNGKGAFTASGSGTQNVGGIGLQETWTVPRFELVAGARADQESFANGVLFAAGATKAAPAATNRAISPRLALRYDLSKELAFRISGGSGFRPPFLNELVRGYVIGPITYLPNPRLVPERSGSFSSGLDWTHGNARISFDFIQTTVSNAIMFRTVTPKIQVRSNVDRTQTDGETLTYTQGLSHCLRLTASGTAQNPRVTAGTGAIVGKYLAYVPAGSGTLELDGAVGALQVGLTGSYLGSTYADDLNTQPLGTAIVAGASVAVPLPEGTQLVLSGENLTGARYLSSIDRYGPPTVLSLSVRVPVHAPTASAGTAPSCAAIK